MSALADRLLAAYDGAHSMALPSAGDPSFALPDAFAAAASVRSRRIERGEKPLGWKIGFTNRSIWARYGVHAPIWGPIWDSTVTLLDGGTCEASLAGLVQPRLEPEIMFGLARMPIAGMDAAELAGCIEWVAHGFEIVHTHFDGWRFTAPDTVADFALHGRLLVGPRIPIDRYTDLRTELAALRIELRKEGHAVESGEGRIVLDGPFDALRTWVDAMPAQSPQWHAAAGDIVSTGTLTDAWPLEPGQTWSTVLSDPRLTGLTLRTTP